MLLHELQGLVAGYVADMLRQTEGRPPQAVVLGCTHYPLVAQHFAAALPAGTRVLDQPSIVADSLLDYLARHGRFAAEPQEAGHRIFLTTGEPKKVSAFASRFFGKETSFEKA